VFHVSLLERWKPRENQDDNTQPPEITPEGKEVWEVEKILGKRIRKGQLQYWLRWKGYDESWDTWTPASDFENMEDLIQEFNQSAQQKRRRGRAGGSRS
jgi:chromobox protein 5